MLTTTHWKRKSQLAVSLDERASQVKELISETQMGVHDTSMKDHLTNFKMIRHGNKQKMQMHTTKRNEQQQQKSHAFQKQIINKKPEKGISLKLK